MKANKLTCAYFPAASQQLGSRLLQHYRRVALGGWLSDNLSWHWCFPIYVPVGLVSLVLIYMIIPSSPEKKKERERLWAKGLNFDWVGFLLIAIFLGRSCS